MAKKVSLIKSAFQLPSELNIHFLDFGTTLRGMIISTKSRLYIASYVISPDFPFWEDLKNLKRNKYDVDIKILTGLPPCKQLRNEIFPYANIKVFEKGTLHMKLVISDGTKCIIGSHNITYSASEKNYEIGILIEGEECYKLEQLFLHLWNF